MTIIDRDPFTLRPAEAEVQSVDITPVDPELYAKGMGDPKEFVLAGLALSVKQGYLDKKRAHQLQEFKTPDKSIES